MLLTVYAFFFLLARGKKEQSLHYEHNPKPENWTCYNDTNEFLNCWNDKVFGLQHKHLDVLERIFAVCGRNETREKSALNKYFIVCIFGLRSLSENARTEWGREKKKRKKQQETCTSNRVYAKSNRCNTPGAYSFLFNFSRRYVRLYRSFLVFSWFGFCSCSLWLYTFDRIFSGLFVLIVEPKWRMSCSKWKSNKIVTYLR